MPTLSEKLKSLGVRVGAQDLAAPPGRKARHPIEDLVPGRMHPTAYGEAFVVETLYPPDYRHGQAPLPYQVSLRTIADWARDARLAECRAGGLVFLDTETTGLAGGTGTYAFLIGLGRLDDSGFRVWQFFMRDPAEEPAVLAALTLALQPDDALVTFNGKAFDVPLLNTRYITNRHVTPLPARAHLDLLPLARRLWRERLESRALGSLEVNILGARRTEEDIPGFLIPQVYFDYLRTGDARPLKRVLYHNAMDVVAMAGLLTHMAALLSDPFGFDAAPGLDLIAIGRLFEEMDRLDEAVRAYERGLASEIPEENFRQAVQRLALLHRRRGDMPAAVELWRDAARTRQIYAFVELAKYYEHGLRDYAEAERWTRDAMALVTSREASPILRAEWQANLEHRLARLVKKRT